MAVGGETRPDDTSAAVRWDAPDAPRLLTDEGFGGQAVTNRLCCAQGASGQPSGSSACQPVVSTIRKRALPASIFW